MPGVPAFGPAPGFPAFPGLLPASPALLPASPGFSLPGKTSLTPGFAPGIYCISRRAPGKSPGFLEYAPIGPVGHT